MTIMQLEINILRAKMSKRVKTAIILVAAALLLALGVYLFFQPVHVPVWMTYPYDVTIRAGGAKINSLGYNR